MLLGQDVTSCWFREDFHLFVQILVDLEGMIFRTNIVLYSVLANLCYEDDLTQLFF